MIEQKRKMTVVGRLWKEKRGESEDAYSGFIEFGLFGRLHVMVLPNDRKENQRDCAMTILMPLDSTPLGIMKTQQQAQQITLATGPASMDCCVSRFPEDITDD